ncbi:hypothetical protein [Crucivirus-266]|nr:hypothetical protein [Crucivirus-265]QMW68750.1 hypothetical protein [Crucivirus-266]
MFFGFSLEEHIPRPGTEAPGKKRKVVLDPFPAPKYTPAFTAKLMEDGSGQAKKITPKVFNQELWQEYRNLKEGLRGMKKADERLVYAEAWLKKLGIDPFTYKHQLKPIKYQVRTCMKYIPFAWFANEPNGLKAFVPLKEYMMVKRVTHKARRAKNPGFARWKPWRNTVARHHWKGVWRARFYGSRWRKGRSSFTNIVDGRTGRYTGYRMSRRRRYYG